MEPGFFDGQRKDLGMELVQCVGEDDVVCAKQIGCERSSDERSSDERSGGERSRTTTPSVAEV